MKRIFYVCSMFVANPASHEREAHQCFRWQRKGVATQKVTEKTPAENVVFNKKWGRDTEKTASGKKLQKDMIWAGRKSVSPPK